MSVKRINGLCNFMTTPLPEIVTRALTRTVVNIGQLTETEKRQLNAAAKRGHLSKGIGGPFPKMKTMWARLGFDFVADREREVAEAMALAELDDKMRERRRGKRKCTIRKAPC